MAEIRVDAVSGRVENSGGLTDSGGTLESAGLEDLPEVSGGDFARLALFTEDPVAGRITAYEIVYVTAHAGAAASATITRGQEGTAGLVWAEGTRWRHVDTAAALQTKAASDAAYVRFLGSATAPITDKTTARPDVVGSLIWFTDFSGSAGGVPDNMGASDLQIRVDEAE